MKILVLVPNLKVSSGGVGNIYKVIDLSNIEGIDYFFVNSSRPLNKVAKLWNSLILFAKYWYKLVAGKYDLVHVNPSLNTKSFYRDAVFILIAKLSRVAVLTFFHGWDSKMEHKVKASNSWGHLCFKLSFAKSDKFIVLGKMFKNKLIAMGVSPNTPFHIHSTVADDSFLTGLNLPEKVQRFHNQINVLFISRLVKEKGLYIAIDAFSRLGGFLENNNRELTLLIAGDGPELSKAKEYVASLGIDNIKFLGDIRGAKKGQVLVNSHIMLFPTFYGEGLPCSILEGMLYGMPIITRAVAGIPDIVQNQINGYVTDSLEPEDFTKFLMEIILDHEKYERMAFENHRVAINNFTSSHVRDRILAVYQTF